MRFASQDEAGTRHFTSGTPLRVAHSAHGGKKGSPLEPGARLSRPSTALSFPLASSGAASAAAGGASSAGCPAPAGVLQCTQTTI